MAKRKKARNNFKFREEYKKSADYLKKSKKFVYFGIGVFFLFAFIGFFIPAPEVLSEKIISYIRGVLEQTKGMNYFELVKFITFNNARSTFFGILLGSFFCVFPLIGLVMNGYILGFISFLSANEDGILSLWRIFPHGIFELPAVFIALGLGIKAGTFPFRKEKFKFLEAHLLESLRIFFLIILPLLIIAGIIETTLIALG